MEDRFSKDILKQVVDAIDNKKGEDIRIIDIGGISVIADYFVVASANNNNQLLAMQDAVDEVMHKNGFSARSIEGNRNSTWILMDYEDLIVHLFAKEDRLFYDLERIWKDGVQIDAAEL